MSACEARRAGGRFAIRRVMDDQLPVQYIDPILSQRRPSSTRRRAGRPRGQNPVRNEIIGHARPLHARPGRRHPHFPGRLSNPAVSRSTGQQPYESAGAGLPRGGQERTGPPRRLARLDPAGLLSHAHNEPGWSVQPNHRLRCLGVSQRGARRPGGRADGNLPGETSVGVWGPVNQPVQFPPNFTARRLRPRFPRAGRDWQVPPRPHRSPSVRGLRARDRGSRDSGRWRPIG